MQPRKNSTTNKAKSQKRTEGDFLKIDLGDGTYAFGRVLADPLCAFYGLRSRIIPDLDTIQNSPVIFKIWVMNYAIKDGVWPVIGHRDLEPFLKESVSFFKKDRISKKLSIYRSGVETAATLPEVIGLENAAVWEAGHVESRLRDYFDGRPNKWVEMLRPDRGS